VLWCGVVWCGVLWCVVVWCGVLWCGVVWCGVVWCGVVWCGVVWCGVVWCGVVWCGVVWCGVVWCGVVWCGVAWCGVAWCGVVWCGVVWFGVVWCGVGWFQIDRFGHFKLWHLGAPCARRSPLVRLRGCLVCSLANSSSTGLQAVSYSAFAAIFNVGWAATQGLAYVRSSSPPLGFGAGIFLSASHTLTFLCHPLPVMPALRFPRTVRDGLGARQSSKAVSSQRLCGHLRTLGWAATQVSHMCVDARRRWLCALTDIQRRVPRSRFEPCLKLGLHSVRCAAGFLFVLHGFAQVHGEHAHLQVPRSGSELCLAVPGQAAWPGAALSQVCRGCSLCVALCRSMVNTLTCNPSSRVALNSCRNAFTMVRRRRVYRSL